MAGGRKKRPESDPMIEIQGVFPGSDLAGIIEAYGNLFPQVVAVHTRLAPVKPAETTAVDTGA
jgi:hypothetical protein